MYRSGELDTENFSRMISLNVGERCDSHIFSVILMLYLKLSKTYISLEQIHEELKMILKLIV